MYYFCGFFGRKYLLKWLALYRSLKQHCPDFRFFALCLDNEDYEIALKLDLPNLNLINCEDFERNSKVLSTAKRRRTTLEYCLTCKPLLLQFVFNNFSNIGAITYLDTDLFFFSDPAPLYAEIADNSIAITPHQFNPEVDNKKLYGAYSTGWLYFKKDKNTASCLSWWQDKCLEWCYTRLEDGKFLDQKYLDCWPSRFKNVIVLRHKGVHLAPWNIANYNLTAAKSHILVDKEPLVFYHFSSIERFERWPIEKYKVKLTELALRKIYAPYIRMLLKINRELPLLLSKPGRENNKIMDSLIVRFSLNANSLAKRLKVLLSYYSK